MSKNEQENNQETVTLPKTYAVLQETSGEESESWLYFLRYQGNEEELAHLQSQLEKVDWYILDDLSTFDLETKCLVSETTAKEMTKIDLNHYSFHRKFDGKLKRIDLGFKEHHTNEKKMMKAFDVLGYGKIEEFIDCEDVDPEDLVSQSESESEESSESESEESSESESENEKKDKHKKGGHAKKEQKKFEIPRFAKAKKHHK